MKIRSGFVSNSSSSSFIIAVPNNATECECCKRSNHWMLQAISTYLGTFTKDGNKFYPITTAESIIECFKAELDDLKGSKEYAENQLNEINELMKDPAIFETYERLRNQLDKLRNRISLAQEAKYGKSFDPSKSLQDRRVQIEKHLAEYEENVAHLQDIIKKVEAYLEKDYTVYSFTIDNWSTEAESAVKKMISDKESGVEVIERIVT